MPLISCVGVVAFRSAKVTLLLRSERRLSCLTVIRRRTYRMLVRLRMTVKQKNIVLGATSDYERYNTLAEPEATVNDALV